MHYYILLLLYLTAQSSHLCPLKYSLSGFRIRKVNEVYRTRYPCQTVKNTSYFTCYFCFFKRSPRQFCLGLQNRTREECAYSQNGLFVFGQRVLVMVYFTEWVYCAVISYEVWQRYKNKGREHYTTLICVLVTWEGIVLWYGVVARYRQASAAWLQFRRSVSLDALRTHGHAFLETRYWCRTKNSNITLYQIECLTLDHVFINHVLCEFK